MEQRITFMGREESNIRQDSLIQPSVVNAEEFISSTRKKKFFILSVNLEGIGLSKRLRSLGLHVAGFIDSRFTGTRHGVDMIHPDLYFRDCHPEGHVLVIATKDREWKSKYLQLAESMGFVRGQNLVTPLDLCRFFPTIEIEGKCNLQCKTCDMGLEGANRGRGHMSHELFRLVLTKMTEEIPFMNSVALYTWGEPLLNPDIAKIVEECRIQGVASEVSTNLDYHKYLDAFLRSEPDQIVAPCAGVGERYERGRTGSQWENYLRGLHQIAEYREKYSLDYNVRIMYHIYKDNLQDDFDYMTRLSRELGFTMIPIVAHIFPGQVFDHVVKKRPLPKEMVGATENLVYSVEEQLAFARTRVNSKCHINYVFPTVSWDGSVLHCCNMKDVKVGAGKWLDQSLQSFIQRRNASSFCTVCMNAGVHRFFDVNVKLTEQDGKREIVRL